MKQKYFAVIFLITLLTITACNQDPQKPNLEAPSPALLSGTIEVSKELQNQADPLSVIFVIARNEMGQIAAVKKLIPPFQYPLQFSLNNEDVMIQGTNMAGKLTVSARVDADGNANPPGPGDIIGEVKELVKTGEQDIRIILDKKL
jgi:hypothetical protein